MKRWFRRVVYLVVLFIWFVLISLPFFAVLVAARGEVHVGSARVFLLQEVDLQGVGLEWERPFPHHPSCTKTTVHYLMWEGQAENTAFCLCADNDNTQCSP